MHSVRLVNANDPNAGLGFAGASQGAATGIRAAGRP